MSKKELKSNRKTKNLEALETKTLAKQIDEEINEIKSPQSPNKLELELLKTNKVVVWLENEVKKLETRFEELS